MRRLFTLVLLAAMALPYLRSPICSTAGHEQDHHHHHPVAGASFSAPDAHGEDSSDCHVLMACGTTLQGVAGDAVIAETARLAHDEASGAPGARYMSPSRSPTPPPPQAA